MKDRNEIMRFFGLHPQNDVRRKFAFTLAEGATHVGNSNNKCKFAFTLAEGATHVDNSNNKRRFAFTLAEVLVTLGIIGVVAVLTVPNVISSYQKKVYVAQLQKGYAQLEQAFALAMADDEVEYLADTELFQSINGDRINSSDDQSAFSSKLGEYMKIQKACQPREFSDGCHDIYYFDLSENVGPIDEDKGYSKAGSNRGGDLQIFTQGNMIYYFSIFTTFGFVSDARCIELMQDGRSVCDAYYDLLIDVNGRKGPNKFGRDFFRFVVDYKGQLVPSGSIAINGRSDYYLNNDFMSCDNGPAYGTGCAAKIMDDGWKMDY